MKVRKWVNDLAIGVRLAIGGGRTATVRLALSAVGIAVAVGVLLVAASIGSMAGNRADRNANTWPSNQEKVDVAPTYWAQGGARYHGETIRIIWLWGSGPDSPKPASLPTLPKPGEMYASPALVDLLRSDEGELLRPRFPERVVGTLDKDVVVMPGDLTAWVGTDETLEDAPIAQAVYTFAHERRPFNPSTNMLAVILLGGVVLLLPVFVFIGSASRVAGAERDRRLSALRLVGAGARQVRWIAAAESLVSAAAGLALGTLFFVVGRQFAEHVELFGERVYVSDIVPDPVLVVAIVLLIPALSVLTTLGALRGTVIDPLGVVRHAKPIRRRALWRFAVMGLGVMLLATQLGLDDDSDLWAGVTVTGAALLLIGVPVLLPWLIERVAGQVRGGPSSWVLAVRRLQLDSGTSARVVGGVAVILAGTIALQSVLLSLDAKGPRPTDTKGQQPTVEVTTTWELAPGVLDAIKQADGVRVAHPVQYLFPYEQSTNYSPQNIAVADCATLHDLGGLNGCQDGDVYSVHDEYAPPPSPGMALEFRKYPDTNNEAWEPDKYEVTGNWTVPSTVKEVRLKDGSPLHGPMFVTPGALNGHTVDDGTASVVAAVNKNFTADQLENIRNSVAKYRWQTYVTTNNTNAEQIVDHSTYAVVRKALYAGSVFTLLLASVSMLVLAVEHIRERRRSMAVLTASGIPRGVLARSLLWQVALPIALGVIVAVLIGTGLAALMLRLTRDNLTIDWSGVTLLCVGATALTLLVSAMTLPFLKRATHLTTIRTE